jgi:hypothetical protein
MSMQPALRPAEEIMEPARLGSFWPSRFSFSQSFLRHLARIGYRQECVECSLDSEGRGRVVFRAWVGGDVLTFVGFSDPLPEDQQQDRIIATRWDAWAALFLGIPSEADLEQSRIEIQKVVWGRAAPGTIVWSRANRSVRLFEHVIASLAAGRQPDPARLNQVGYLIRTTGFSGNGRNGMHDYAHLRAIGHPLRAPYHAQMLAAYLWREFGFELAEHMARQRNPDAARLAPEIRRFMGIGNASGLGLVPFVVRHPRLVQAWIAAREGALAKVLAQPFGRDDARCGRFAALLRQARDYFRNEPGGEFQEFASGEELASELDWAEAAFARGAAADAANPVAALVRASAHLSPEGQELLHVLALELLPDDGDEAEAMHADESLSFDAAATTGALAAQLRAAFGWSARFRTVRPFFWYASEENMEPRRGERGVDEGEPYELPVDILGRLEELLAALDAADPGETLGRFVLRHPDLRFMLGWGSSLAQLPYAVARMDLMAPDFAPLRIMRFQLATYGMLKFRPQSRSWLRATILQGAGLPEELAAGHPGDGLFPRLPAAFAPAARREHWE